MIDTLYVLLVEDEKQNVEQWRDAEESFNTDAEAHGFAIVSENVASVAEAKAIFAHRKFDAVVVDLRLKPQEGSAGPNDDGNTLIRHLIDTVAVGIVVYTGQAAEFDAPACPQVKVLGKEGGLEPVFDWLKAEFELFKGLASARETIERETARVFFSAVWPRWKTWTQMTADPAELREAMARHVVAHIHDVLLSNVAAAHFEESYFVPPVKKSLDTGDLVSHEGDLWIVVTPRCDLAIADKTKTLLFARCKDCGPEWSRLGEGRGADQARADFQQHKKSFRQHFLPPLLMAKGDLRGPWLVQFDDLLVQPASIREKVTQNRFASLSPQFVPSLVERFGAYFSRIGTPNLSE